MPARILAVNIVHALVPGPKETRLTAIDKRPQTGRIAVTPLGLAGDTQMDKKNHGGPDQALYAYAREDLDWWESQLDRDLAPGFFGENLTTAGLDVTNALLGERWRIGPEVEVEVRSARIPCITFEARMGLKGWIKRFHAERRPGAYLKVHRTGTIAAGDEITVLDRPGHEMTVGLWFQSWAGEADVPRTRGLLASGIDLEPELRAAAERVVARA